MDALVKETPGKGLVLKQVKTPAPGIGEVLIQIHKTAICGTDVHIYNWDDWSQKTIHPPMVVGHEYVGHIAAVGPGVDDYHVGQVVTGEGHIVCGHCRNCRAGNGHWCRFTKGVGVNRDGAFADHCIGNERHRRAGDHAGGDCRVLRRIRQRLPYGDHVRRYRRGRAHHGCGADRHDGRRHLPPEQSEAHVVTDVNDYRPEIVKDGASATVNL